ATAQGLYEVRSDGSGQRMLAAGTFDLLTWAPDGVRVAYVRGTALWLGQVVTPGAGGTGSTLESARATVDAFMRARVAANADQASSQLDATASAAYGTDGLQLTSSGLTRYYVVAAQQFPAGPRFVVRLIFSKDKFETQYLDETLTLQTDSQGKLLIHTASASPKQDLGKGPLVTSVDVAPGVVKLQFDSDLDAKSVAGAVVVSSGLGSQPQATVSFQGNRTVLVDTSQLTAGATYHLTVQTSLKDVNGRAVPTAYQVDVIALKPTS
ncbi:MAG TPA: Ig-like domain-containing protein, partial [Streptosporangiaceae bacterium]